jgi:hypothetical protein
VQVMIEGAGHVPINQLEHHARWQEFCLKGRMLYSSLGSVKPTPSSVGRGTAPPRSPTLRGAQMDLGPPGPFVPLRICGAREMPSRPEPPPISTRSEPKGWFCYLERALLEDLAAGPRTSAELTVNCGMPAVPRLLARLERFGFARRSRQ